MGEIIKERSVEDARERLRQLTKINEDREIKDSHEELRRAELRKHPLYEEAKKFWASEAGIKAIQKARDRGFK